MRALGAVLLAFALVACEARLELGGRCVRSRECSSPYVCVGSRCRAECTDHRDCDLGARCVAGDDGASFCTLEDDRCTSDADCGEDLVCRDGGCFDLCAGGSCPAGGECSAGLCVRPGDAPDAGPMPDAGLPARIACTSDADCGGGACARVLGGAFTCRPRCTTVGDCPLGSGTVGCAWFRSIAGGDVAACSIPCDPFSATTGCLPGEACDVLELSTATGINALVVDCRPIDAGAVGPREPCGDGGGGWVPTLCAAGLVCDGVGPGYTCQELCALSATVGPPCPGGTECQAFSAAELRHAGARLGSCDPL